MKYDGFDFRPFLRVEDINRPLISEISTQTETYAGREGSVFGSSSRAEKIIEVTVRLIRPYNDTFSLNDGFEKARRQLAGRLYRTEPCKLWLHDAPDVYEMAIMSGQSEIEKLVYTRVSTLTFLCPSPSSYGVLRTENSTGGKVICRVDGNDVTEPLVAVSSTGPFTVKFDGADFEVTQSVTGEVFIDARRYDDEPTGHRVFTSDMQTVAYSIYSDFPVWTPGVHTVECSRPFAVSWRERWL